MLGVSLCPELRPTIVAPSQRITMHVGIPSIVRAELRANTFGQVVGPGCWARFAEFTIYLYTVAGVLSII